MSYKRPASVKGALWQLHHLVGRRMNGARRAKYHHLRRMRHIVSYVYRHYQVGVCQVKVKHLRSFLEYIYREKEADEVRDYVTSVFQLVCLLDKERDWLPRLYGPWARPEARGALPAILQGERRPTPPCRGPFRPRVIR